MTTLSMARWRTATSVVAVLVLCAGCGSLLPQPSAPPAFYVLDGSGPNATAAVVQRPAGLARGLVLVVNPPNAAAGYDSAHIVYVRAAHQLETFAYSEWVDTPARMLAPLIVAALQPRGGFSAVVLSAGAAEGELRLDTDIVRLQQQFGGPRSQVRFTLRATVLDGASRRVLAWREFDETVTAERDDPVAGVAAANEAVRKVLVALAPFCEEAAGRWRPAAGP